MQIKKKLNVGVILINVEAILINVGAIFAVGRFDQVPFEVWIIRNNHHIINPKRVIKIYLILRFLHLLLNSIIQGEMIQSEQVKG